MKILGIVIYHRPSHVFTYKTHCCEPLTQHLVICANLGSSNVCPFKKPFRLSIDAINHHKWCSCFFTSYAVDDQMLYKDITMLPLSPLSSLLIILCFWGTVIVPYFLLEVVPLLLIFGTLKAIRIAQYAQYSPNNPRCHRMSHDTGS